jgi:bifunctional UDP-N-acetylglucosamine pyrophosphorylase/glucosamine-1-phosphate N-acetyltransferase
MASVTAVILAAGQGTRMKSRLPKGLHPLAGQPLLQYLLDAARAVTGGPPVLVVGRGAEQLRAAFGERAVYVTQAEQKGTGHALLQAEPALKGRADLVLALNGDLPLLEAETLRALVAAQQQNSGPLTLLSVISERVEDFGRVVRSPTGAVHAVVEKLHLLPEHRHIHEFNVGAYCFRADWLWGALARLPVSPKGEYYLTDAVHLAVSDGLRVEAVSMDDEAQALGINDRMQLAQVEAELRRRLNEKWMAEGVTLRDPATTYIAATVTLGRDTVILPNTHLEGRSEIGEDCVIGPNTIVRDTTIGDRCRVESSVLEGAWLDEEVQVGPFAHLRRGARLERGVHLGNFGEVKNSTLGPGTRMGHFSYIGDATIGAQVNIGAGTITCNFDGLKKNPTDIGAGAFIGSDTLLVAPVRVGQNARTGAGAVVTKNVPDESLAVGMPARVIRKNKS